MRVHHSKRPFVEPRLESIYFRSCSECTLSPHTDVSAEKLLRNARMAGLVKLRRGIQRTGQRRLWAGHVTKGDQVSQLCKARFLRIAAASATRRERQIIALSSNHEQTTHRLTLGRRMR